MRALRSLSGTGTTTPTAAEVPPGYLSAFDIIQETEREKDRVRRITACQKHSTSCRLSNNHPQALGLLIAGLGAYTCQLLRINCSKRSCQGCQPLLRARARMRAVPSPPQVEQLLETYFMNLDNTFNKLQTLGEYIDDTEDYIQFDLDTKRNKFIEARCALAFLGRAAFGPGA